MKVLLTGGTGFVGMNIAEKLLDEGIDVVIYDISPLEDIARDSLENRKGRFTYVNGDILDFDRLNGTIGENGIDTIIHGAVITPSQQKERGQGKKIIEVNCLGTINSLDAAVQNKVDKFIYLASLSAYGKTAFEGTPLMEDVSVPKPNSLYELTKFTAERTVIRYRQLFGINAIVARLGDVFGPWEHYSGARDFMSFPYQTTRLAMLGQKALLPRPCLLDWVYSRDVANSVYAILKSETLQYDTYPVCSGYIWPISDWCQLLTEKFSGFSFELVGDPDTANIKVNQSKDNAPMSTSRLVENTGYRPVYDLKKSFADYMAWLGENPAYIR